MGGWIFHGFFVGFFFLMGEDQCPHGAEDVDFRDLNGHFTMGDPFFEQAKDLRQDWLGYIMP